VDEPEEQEKTSDLAVPFAFNEFVPGLLVTEVAIPPLFAASPNFGGYLRCDRGRRWFVSGVFMDMALGERAKKK